VRPEHEIGEGNRSEGTDRGVCVVDVCVGCNLRDWNRR
jgi:hypothetical protein